jgi:hypothetical protein
MVFSYEPVFVFSSCWLVSLLCCEPVSEPLVL